MLSAAYDGNPFLLRHILSLIPEEHIQEVAVAGEGDLYKWTARHPLIAHVSLAHLPLQHQLVIMQAISNPQVLAIAQVLCSGEHTQQEMIKAITKAQAIFEFYRAIPSMYTHPSLHPLSPISRLIESYKPETDTTYHYAMAMLNCYEQLALLQIHSMLPTFFSMLLLSSGRSPSQIKATTMALRFLHLTSHVQSHSHSTSSYLLARSIHEPTPLPAYLLPYKQVRIVCHMPLVPFFSSKRSSFKFSPDVVLVHYVPQRDAGSARKAIMALRTKEAEAHIGVSDSRLPHADYDIQATGAAPLYSTAVPLDPTSSAYTHAGSQDTNHAIIWDMHTALRPSSTTSEDADHLPQFITAEGLYQNAVAGMFLVHNFHSVKYFVQNVLHLDTERMLDAISPTHILSADVALGTVAVGATYAAGGAVVPIVQAASIAVSTCAAHEITRALHANMLLSQNVSAPIQSVSDFAVQCGPQVALGAGSVYALSMLAAFTPFVWPPVAGIASAVALNGAMCFNAHNAPASSSGVDCPTTI